MIDDNQSLVCTQTPTKQISDGVWRVEDHMSGFDSQGINQLLSSLPPSEIQSEYIFPKWIKQKYSQHRFKFDAELMIQNNGFSKIIEHRSIALTETKNFLCCFNRSGHVGRQWLVESLYVRGLFDPEYCSKGFVTPNGKFNAVTHNFKRKQVFHGAGGSTDTVVNFKELSPLIQTSFINLVSETMPESYVPFPTEKFLFPILNKRLWIAYAPLGYHELISKVLGFRLYEDFFDYSFDKIADPNDRLTSMVDQIEPYSKLSRRAWSSIYKVLEPVIEHNYHWATSGEFINRLRELNEVK